MTSATGCDILLTVTSFGGGGTERYVEDLAVGLAGRGLHIAIAVDSGSLERARGIDAAGIPVATLSRGPLTSSEYVSTLRATIEKLKPRVVHSNAWLHQFDIAKATSEQRVPLIFTNHSTPPPVRFRERLGMNRSPFAFYRERSMFSNRASVICVSQLALQRMRARIGTRLSATAVYNGVSEVDIDRRSRSKGNASVVWIGSFIHRKRPLMALSAFKLTLERYPTAHFTMVGDGPLLAEVRSAADALPSGSVTLTGFQHSPMDFILESDVYLQTSMAEGLPYTVLEAMSASLPVVATNAGATSEAVVDGVTGLVCTCDDSTAIASSLMSLIGSPVNREQYGKAGLKRVRSLFSMNRMLDETVDAYNQLCGVAFC